MDSEQNKTEFGPVYIASDGKGEVKKEVKRTGWKIFVVVVIGLCMLAMGAAFVLLVGVVTMFRSIPQDVFTEEVIRSGNRWNKIVLIDIQGFINREQAEDFYQQLRTVQKDNHVKGLIVRVNSPGGTVSGSDQIYNEILNYREKTNKPVVAFMQGVAASGGYYVSVACDKVMSEPTTITGSVGVIMGYLVLEQLLEEKLGIHPVISKSGMKKDWPSSFRMPTDEEKQYIQDKLIKPAYERFVGIVAKGRESLSLEEVRSLSDGSVYSAQEAMDEKLIDGIGYLDEAIEEVMTLAGIEDGQVVAYKRPFSFSSILRSQRSNILNFDSKT
ncbi:MAG: signal peptide peptidase SppA, partial [Sedimentisphaerales bacterium]|nr:signal peptide peptidase SppA [Sedimentisphaerales bacterium]